MVSLPWVYPLKKSASTYFSSHQLLIDPQLEVRPPKSLFYLCWNIYHLSLVQATVVAAVHSWVSYPCHVQRFFFFSNTSKLLNLRTSPAPLQWCSLSFVWRRYVLLKSLCLLGHTFIRYLIHSFRNNFKPMKISAFTER